MNALIDLGSKNLFSFEVGVERHISDRLQGSERIQSAPRFCLNDLGIGFSLLFGIVSLGDFICFSGKFATSSFIRRSISDGIRMPFSSLGSDSNFLIE